MRKIKRNKYARTYADMRYVIRSTRTIWHQTCTFKR